MAIFEQKTDCFTIIERTELLTLARLERKEFTAIRSLFKPMLHHPMCAAVVAGAYPGEIYVDNRDRPGSALLMTFISREEDGIWAFLAGDPSNAAFNQALNHALFEKSIIRAEAPTVWITSHPESWQESMAIICSPREPIAIRRRRYEASKPSLKPIVELPEGISIEALDRVILLTDIEIMPQVRSILSRWRSVKDPVLKDYGFAAVSHGSPDGAPQIASYTTVDFVVDGLAEIGVFTAPSFRRRGLATLSTLAAMGHGREVGVIRFNWSCSDDNIGSIKLAEKMGFERRDDYMITLLIFDEAMNLAESAYRHLLAGDYREVIGQYERFFEIRDDPPIWAFLDNARAWAGLGDENQAFEYINRAIDRGLRDRVELESYPELQHLHSKEAWKTAVKRIDELSKDVQALQ